jgi:Transposase DDE domain
VTNDLDALLTALYVEIDDHVVPPRVGRGRRSGLTDAELVTLAVAQVLLGVDNEHRWMRVAYGRLGHLFRYLPKQPDYNKRLRAAAPLLAQAISHLARVSPSWCDSLRLLDATPLPCGASRETARRSDIAGSGGYGFCASHSRYYWGLKLYLLTAPDGMPITWCLADPKLGEREVCLDLLTIAVETGVLAPGSTVLADKGLAGREIEAQIAALGLRMLRPDRRDERTRHGNLGGVRQWIESVYDTLKGQLGLEQHAARTPHGAFTRVAQRLLALAAAIWHNWAVGAPDKRSLIAYDH